MNACPLWPLEADSPTGSQRLSMRSASTRNDEPDDWQTEIFSDADATFFENAKIAEEEISPVDGENIELLESEAVSESQEELFSG